MWTFREATQPKIWNLMQVFRMHQVMLSFPED
jgi:hypothetical protein